MYDCESDNARYKQGVDGAHLMIPFQCDLCVYRTLFKRDPTSTVADIENLRVIRRMNLDAIWSREPSTITKNYLSVNLLISSCEASGFEPQLPKLGPFPFEDCMGYSVAFSMLLQSRRPGKHSRMYTQFATIRKQRSAFSNLYMASQEAAELGTVIAQGSQTSSVVTKCPTNSMWFGRWVSGCETRMGYILKQNKAISYEICRALIDEFKRDISNNEEDPWNQMKDIMGLTYTIVCFCASLRGSEGMKIDYQSLVKYFHEGSLENQSQVDSVFKVTPHVVIPIKGRFKGEKGERCHLLPLANVTKSGINIRGCLKLMIAARNNMRYLGPWAFINRDGKKMEFSEMNNIILEKLESIQARSERTNQLGLNDVNIREEYSINRSFRRGSSTHAQNCKVPSSVIEAQNRWRKVERAKGARAKFTMIETYADIEQLIPTLVRYSAML